MSEFKREARFIVIKRKHLSAESRVHESLEQELRVWLDKHLIPTSECVVVESDWPEYETVWAMISARVEGRPTPYQVLEQQVAALRQHKNDYMEAAEGTRRALNSELEKKGLLLSEMHEALSVADNRIEAAKAEAQALREEIKNRTAECNGLHEMLRQEHDRTEKAREEVAALRTRVVVAPGRIPSNGPKEEWYLTGWNACLDELARLNGKAVSEGLLRRCEQMLQFYFEYLCDESAEEVDITMAAEALDELRALLGEGKENGHA